VKILTAEQLKKWDAATIEKESMTSLELMERAALKCVEWLENKQFKLQSFFIFCGKGNNGGDGLAIARLLAAKGKRVQVYILESGKTGSDDFLSNLRVLRELSISIHFIQGHEHFQTIDPTAVVIDALFGAGLNKPLEGISKALVDHINKSGAEIVSIDLPSGLYSSQSSFNQSSIEATYTLTFQTYKLALLLAENAPYIGEVYSLDIHLNADFYNEESSSFETLELKSIQHLYKPRNRFAHKGNFGHALLIGGSYGKIGALVLAAKACAHSGCGLVTTYLPTCGYNIIQTALPEAMAITDNHKLYITEAPQSISSFAALGIGPGLGTSQETMQAVASIITEYNNPMVIDADALNCISLQKELLTQLPHHSILTPHPKEFDRLFGTSKNEVERIEKAIANAKALQVIIVLKGHHTLIALPDGKGYFNTTGNAGMAKGGSGDVLTGIITSLLAQGYHSKDAAILGVYIHGLAGDFAAQSLSQEFIIASDIINTLPSAFNRLTKKIA
jgi:hydroxyethylthiazole kinase-like uncharacterized protein yjeF